MELLDLAYKRIKKRAVKLLETFAKLPKTGVQGKIETLKRHIGFIAMRVCHVPGE